jgi:uncharacterized protein (TIGR03083 family)
VSHLLPDVDVVRAYLECRGRIVSLLRSLPPECAGEPTPLCPQWTVADLAAHVVGVPEDILAGRTDGVGTDPWTQAQVERSRGQSLEDLADRFEATAEQFDVVAPMIPAPTSSQLVMDAITHEHDLRQAVDRPGARDALGVRVALGFLLDAADGREAGLAERLRAAVDDDFELLRSLSGRRSVDQMVGLGLDVDAVGMLLTDSPMRPPAAAIET